MVVAAAVLLLRVSQSGQVRGDAAVALSPAGALAVGRASISLTSGSNTNVSELFGSIPTISSSDAVLNSVNSARRCSWCPRSFTRACRRL